MKKKNTGILRPAISNKDLEDDLLEFLLIATTVETYIIHCDLVVIAGRNRNFLLNTCGMIKKMIKDCGPPLELCIGEDLDPARAQARARLRTRIQVLLLTIKVEDFETIPLSCDPDTFLETLLINIKNETISHQSYMRKAKLKKLKDLENQIISLKKTPVNNTDEILRKEKELNLLRDFEMRSELERFRHFDILNNEKMSPRFIALTKIKANSDPLDKVCKADGSAFATALERQEYINNFYQSIYTPDPANQVLSPTVIEDFLGLVICESDVVKKSKLTQDEMLHFDRPITLQELDHATYSLNEKSAGGLDGIGAKFLKKFWFLLRQPMLKYVTHCFNTGNLTQSFSSAGIKLIPKKGDTRQIKNWRPISLLNCVFKIIAKTVDTRLQKINEIILTRAQKGFTKNRQIQECIINIVETIAYSEKKRFRALF
jgi:hypothetical protein